MIKRQLMCYKKKERKKMSAVWCSNSRIDELVGAVCQHVKK